MKLRNFGHYLITLINSTHTVIIVIFMEIILKPLNLNDKSPNVSMTVLEIELLITYYDYYLKLLIPLKGTEVFQV